MNKLKLATGVILVFLVGALAGALGSGIYYKQRVRLFEAGGPPMTARVQIVLERFSNKLDLTRAQRIELEKIVRESQEKILALGRELLPEIEKINEQSFALMRDALNSEQNKKLDVLYQRMKDFRGRFSNQPPPPQRPQEPAPRQRIQEPAPPQRTQESVIAEMKDRLKLTQEQEQKLRTIMETSAKERKEVMEKYRRQGPPDDSPLRRELRKIEKSVEKGLSDILTEEQMEKYRILQEEGRFQISPPGMS